MKTWNQPFSNGTSRPVSGLTFGYLGLCRATESGQARWQLDHIPSGYRVFPSSGLPATHLGYNTIRTLATRIGYSPLWAEVKPELSSLEDPARTQLRTIITQVLLDMGKAK